MTKQLRWTADPEYCWDIATQHDVSGHVFDNIRLPTSRQVNAASMLVYFGLWDLM